MADIPTIAFLFDLDGVVIDTEKSYSEIWDRINQKFPTNVPDFPRKIKGTTLQNILNSYFDDAVRSDVVEMLNDSEKKMVYEYCEGAEPFLQLLHNNHYKTALVTSSNDRKLAQLRKQLPQLEDFFTVIIDANKVSKSKPDPEGYLKAAAQLGIEPKRCVVFEDSLQGVKAGKAAGCLVVGIVGTMPAETLQPHCDFLVDNLGQVDINTIIKALQNR